MISFDEHLRVTNEDFFIYILCMFRAGFVLCVPYVRTVYTFAL